MQHLESEIQRACVQWFRLQYPERVIFAIPNGGRRGIVEAAIMKGEGVLAGAADLFVMEARKGLHGLFIEMKSAQGRQTYHQTAFEAQAKERGYGYVVCRSASDFAVTINNYFTT